MARVKTFTTQNGGPYRSVGPLALKHLSLAPKHPSLAPRRASLAPKQHSLAPKSPSLALKHASLALNHASLALDHAPLAINQPLAPRYSLFPVARRDAARSSAGIPPACCFPLVAPWIAVSSGAPRFCSSPVARRDAARSSAGGGLCLKKPRSAEEALPLNGALSPGVYWRVRWRVESAVS